MEEKKPSMEFLVESCNRELLDLVLNLREDYVKLSNKLIDIITECHQLHRAYNEKLIKVMNIERERVQERIEKIEKVQKAAKKRLKEL